MDQEKEREEKFKILKEIFKTHAHFEHARGKDSLEDRLEREREIEDMRAVLEDGYVPIA